MLITGTSYADECTKKVESLLTPYTEIYNGDYVSIRCDSKIPCFLITKSTDGKNITTRLNPGETSRSSSPVTSTDYEYCVKQMDSPCQPTTDSCN